MVDIGGKFSLNVAESHPRVLCRIGLQHRLPLSNDTHVCPPLASSSCLLRNDLKARISSPLYEAQHVSSAPLLSLACRGPVPLSYLGHSIAIHLCRVAAAGRGQWSRGALS